ncbi:phosphotransferase [Nonomuraea sp. NPDC050643]|uniref:phosphotransferase n=1 Tax=Nonomuraea sp. NPDC050643 TaxID=3155660 RepID=UPI0033E252B4
MEIGELLGSGRSADVYALGDDRVLRRYRADIDAGREAAIMAYVAAHGYPVPEVHPGQGRPTDLVMGRLSGPTMLHALFAGEIAPEQVGDILARLLRRLHEIPVRQSAAPGDRILHLDLHPDNVMLTPRGPVVIDWCNAAEGRPELDCALSVVILAQAAVDPELPDWREPAHSSLRALVAALGEALDVGEPLELARARRGADRAMSERETGLLDEAVALIRRLR